MKHISSNVITTKISKFCIMWHHSYFHISSSQNCRVCIIEGRELQNIVPSQSLHTKDAHTNIHKNLSLILTV